MNSNENYNFSTIAKEVDESVVNEKLKEGWILITAGNMMQVQNVREGNDVKKQLARSLTTF